MIFLGPLYQYLHTELAGRINHFPLIRLVVLSIDKTILYLLIFIVLRLLYRKIRGRRGHWGRELLIAVFTGYIFLLLFLTVFRGQYYYPWQLVFHWQRSVSDINLRPLIETLKLSRGATMFDFYYQSLGNVAWFVPLGILAPVIMDGQRKMRRTVLSGAALSLCIELLQFFLITGVTDIDDWIFNTIGALLGYTVYAIGAAIFKPNRH